MLPGKQKERKEQDCAHVFCKQLLTDYNLSLLALVSFSLSLCLQAGKLMVMYEATTAVTSSPDRQALHSYMGIGPMCVQASDAPAASTASVDI